MTARWSVFCTRATAKARTPMSASGTSAVRPVFRVSRLLLGALTAILGHAVTFGAGFVAGRTVSPSSGGGFEDIAAVALVFLGGQAILGLGCIIASVVLLVKGRQDFAAGLIIAWAIGLATVVVLVSS